MGPCATDEACVRTGWRNSAGITPPMVPTWTACCLCTRAFRVCLGALPVKGLAAAGRAAAVRVAAAGRAATTGIIVKDAMAIRYPTGEKSACDDRRGGTG